MLVLGCFKLGEELGRTTYYAGFDPKVWCRCYFIRVGKNFRSDVCLDIWYCDGSEDHVYYPLFCVGGLDLLMVCRCGHGWLSRGLLYVLCGIRLVWSLVGTSIPWVQIPKPLEESHEDIMQ